MALRLRNTPLLAVRGLSLGFGVVDASESEHWVIDGTEDGGGEDPSESDES